MRGNRGQRSGAESVRSSHELSQAIRYLPPPRLPQPAWRCLGMERVMGIEPTLAAWEAAVLPLNYTRVDGIVREVWRARQSGLLRYARLRARLRGLGIGSEAVNRTARAGHRRCSRTPRWLAIIATCAGTRSPSFPDVQRGADGYDRRGLGAAGWTVARAGPVNRHP